MNVVMIGSGNVATHFSSALRDAGFSVVQVFSRTENHAHILAKKLECPYVVDITDITKDADFYVFAVKDDALQHTIALMPETPKGIWIHTAGSVSMDAFNGMSERYGVIYPLQTFSKNREVDFRKVPLFIEANNPVTLHFIEEMASALSVSVNVIDSEKRMYLHLAAVFACNFTNHLYAIASDIVGRQGVDCKILQPLIDETANKLYSMTPREAQTGPAVRNDRKVMEKHLKIIEKEEKIRGIYKWLSESINQI